MAKTPNTLKVFSANREIASHHIAAGEKLIIPAQQNVHYQLIDDQSGLAPKAIQAQRQGNDLIIKLDESTPNPDITLQNYYLDNASNSSLTGKFSDGNIYYYVPASGNLNDSPQLLLAESQLRTQVLGGKALSAATWAFNPWWLLGALPLVGEAALASGSKGKAGPKGDKGATGDKGSTGTNDSSDQNSNTETPTLKISVETRNTGNENLLNINNIAGENNEVRVIATIDSNVAKEGGYCSLYATKWKRSCRSSL